MNRVDKLLKCKRCGWAWFPIKTEVKICPRCKSPNWNKERDTRRGLRGGNETSIHEIRDNIKNE